MKFLYWLLIGILIASVIIFIAGTVEGFDTWRYIDSYPFGLAQGARAVGMTTIGIGAFFVSLLLIVALKAFEEYSNSRK